MRKHKRLFVAIWGLAAITSTLGCGGHKHAGVLPSPNELTPPPQEVAVPMPQPTPAVKPEPSPAPQPAAKPVHHAKAKPAAASGGTSTQTTTAGSAADARQLASASAVPATSAIGQLSEGGSGGNSRTRGETVDLIASTDKGLHGITRPLSPQEKQTVAQVAKFLQQARDALRNQDVDAAHTLAVKAKVLLGELLN